MNNIVPLTAFTAPVTVVQNGDPGDSTSIIPSVQALADRTQWLRYRVTQLAYNDATAGANVTADIIASGADEDVISVAFTGATSLVNVRSLGNKDANGATLPLGTVRIVVLRTNSGSGASYRVLHNTGAAPAGCVKISTPIDADMDVGTALDATDQPVVLMFVLETAVVDVSTHWRLVAVLGGSSSYALASVGGVGQALAKELVSRPGMMAVVTGGVGDLKFAALHARQSGSIWNDSGAALTLYPPVAGTINALAANAGIALADKSIWQWYGNTTGAAFKVIQIG